MTPKEIVEELFRRGAAGDMSVVDELVAADMVNHAAGPQGRDGWKAIIELLRHDLGATDIEHHHLIADGDLVAHHMTMHGTHEASTMPLLTGVPVTHRPVSWTFIHIWRVSGGQIVEHWACRDDVGLLAQVGAWPPAPRTGGITERGASPPARVVEPPYSYGSRDVQPGYESQGPPPVDDPSERDPWADND